jgi:hypothetical protein
MTPLEILYITLQIAPFVNKVRVSKYHVEVIRLCVFTWVSGSLMVILKTVTNGPTLVHFVCINYRHCGGMRVCLSDIYRSRESPLVEIMREMIDYVV